MLGVSYPDIDSRFRNLGQETSDRVTLPVLKDLGRFIPDSWAIAKYLEESVPSPTIFPGGIAAHEKFQDYVRSDLQPNVLMWLLPQIPPILDERGAEYFRRTREKTFGCSLEEKSKGGDAEWLPILRRGMTPIFHALKGSGAYILGQEFGYADCYILSLCQWIERADVTKLDKFIKLDADGNLAEWYARCEPYTLQMN